MARADGARASHTFSSARLSPAPSAQAAAASRPWAGLPGRCSPAAHPDSAPRRCRGLSRPPAPPSQLGLAHPPGAPRDLVLGWWARRGGLRADAAATGVLASPETSALVPALFPGSVGLPLMSVPRNPGRGDDVKGRYGLCLADARARAPTAGRSAHCARWRAAGSESQCGRSAM